MFLSLIILDQHQKQNVVDIGINYLQTVLDFYIYYLSDMILSLFFIMNEIKYKFQIIK
jgi:hypothetical protein